MKDNEVKSAHYYEDQGKLKALIHIDRHTKDCPYCGYKKIKRNGVYTRTQVVPFRLSDSIEVTLKLNRYLCLGCHHSFSDSVAIGPKNYKISYATIRSIMDLLLEPSMTFKLASRITGVAESTVIRTFDKNCNIPRTKLPEAICIDEIYTKNNSYENSKYSCIIYDFYNQSIVDVTPCRKKEFMHSYFEGIPEEERLGVHYASIDMYKTYKDLLKMYFKKAIICVDSFHVISHLNESLANIRIRVMGDYPTDSQEYYLLKKWRNLLFDNGRNLDNKGKFNKKFNRVMTLRDLQNALLDIHPDLKRGYELKEMYMRFNQLPNKEEAEKMYDSILDEFVKANIFEYKDFVTILCNWKNEIINSFIKYKGRRMNSSVAESINSKVSLLISNTHGIRNEDRRRKRILYCVNKQGFSFKNK